MPPIEVNRRRFLHGAAAAGLALSQGQTLEGAIEAETRPVRLGIIGLGNRGTTLARNLLEIPKTQIVAVCDAYEPRRAEAREKLAPDAREYEDYRQVLDRKDIDAVFIGSPDHWHVTMAVDALRAGKDVYVEKPVSHNVEEGGRLIVAVDETKRVLQAGYQQRS